MDLILNGWRLKPVSQWIEFAIGFFSEYLKNKTCNFCSLLMNSLELKDRDSLYSDINTHPIVGILFILDYHCRSSFHSFRSVNCPHYSTGIKNSFNFLDNFNCSYKLPWLAELHWQIDEVNNAFNVSKYHLKEHSWLIRKHLFALHIVDN